MSWVKRNLYFLIGAGVAVSLLGLAGFYLFSKVSLNNENDQKLSEAYREWNGIVGAPISPGNNEVNNIQNARDHQQQVVKVIDNVRRQFVPIPAIPNSPEVGREEFANALRTTIERMTRDAASAGVSLAPGYKFTFNEQSRRVSFTGSLEPLAIQLGEIRAICDVLFRAKINSLDNVRRERVSADDQQGLPGDYLEPTVVSVTNDLGVLTPYEITFQCFSTELGSVLSQFANQPNGIVVRAINVEPSQATGGTDPSGMPITGSTYPQQYYTPTYQQPRSTYGETVGPDGTSLVRPAPTYQPVAPAPVRPATATAAPLIDEKQLKVTMTLSIVKLLPPK